MGMNSQFTKDELDGDSSSSDIEIEPYIIKKHDGNISLITETNAVSIVNFYCVSLYKSVCVMLTPTWVKKDIVTSDGSKSFQV